MFIRVFSNKFIYPHMFNPAVSSGLTAFNAFFFFFAGIIVYILLFPNMSTYKFNIYFPASFTYFLVYARIINHYLPLMPYGNSICFFFFTMFTYFSI